jgi:GT2 family glycosyltransferase
VAVVPTYVRTAEDLDVLLRCLVSLRETAPRADVLVVDDASPATELVDMIAVIAGELEIELVRRPVNGGFARTVNVGLQRALDEGRDAVLVNADIEFHRSPWLEPMLERADTTGAPAAVVGARLLYPNGLLQHAGLHYSTLHRFWGPRLAYGAGDLAEALVPSRCPVTGALQLIRHECLEAVGLYDERFRMGWEDVDYCLRVDVRVLLRGRRLMVAPRISIVQHDVAVADELRRVVVSGSVQLHGHGRPLSGDICVRSRGRCVNGRSVSAAAARRPLSRATRRTGRSRAVRRSPTRCCGRAVPRHGSRRDG